ncbi:MAG: hypothetical protein JST00_26565 [Deltaproteobacteria bacterium]|nr:hypothetical protein [Deltaproteobacteria bacterium]
MASPPDPSRLTNEELEEVVEEIAKDHASDADGVSSKEAREVLRDLDLPAEKLEEAAAKVRVRREAEAREKTQKKQRLALGAALLAAVLAVAGGVVMWTQAKATKVARITAVDPVLAEEPGQLRLSAKLMSAPEGEAVPMRCAWRSPEGALLHENAWQTKPVSHDAWETHCILKGTPAHVKVTMTAHGKVVAESSR